MLSALSLAAAVPSVAHDPQGSSPDPVVSFNMSRLPPGLQAVPFELTALDGTRVKSRDLAGKVVLLNFWATWCGPCKEEMPSLARLQKQFDPAQFVLLTVTADVQRHGIAQFLSHAGVTLPVLFDEDQEVSRSFMVRGLPTTIVIGRDGTLTGRAVGPRAWDSPEAVAMIRQAVGQTK